MHATPVALRVTLEATAARPLGRRGGNPVDAGVVPAVGRLVVAVLAVEVLDERECGEDLHCDRAAPARRTSNCPPVRFDLQSHSTRSDGALEPEEVVARAAAAGVELLALTDHDTVDGVEAALRAAREHGIALVPATELSAVHGAHEDFHVCGYGIDHADPAFRERLADWRADRGRRIWAMADCLEALGRRVDRDALAAHEAAGLPLGRPHLADAIRRPGETDDVLFPRYLVPGAAAYVARERPSVPEAVAAIHAAGGVAVWAHPFWDLAEREAVLATLESFVEAGIDGVEVFYVTHTREQTEWLHAQCSERGLLITGSSDFHAPGHERFSGFLAFETYGLEPALGPILPAPE